ncbi:MAG: TIM barrel protein [Clostridia bacterium]|nr:TIM barrel protein [Clostridia bacterium]
MEHTVAILCDMHLSADRRSPQYAYFLRAVEQMKRDGIQYAVTLGDITAFGDPAAWELYRNAMEPFSHCEIIGNADVRDKKTARSLETLTEHAEMMLGERRILGLNTPNGEISAHDWARLCTVNDGDVVLLHYYLDALKEPCRTRFLEFIKERRLTVLHGHAHRDFDYTVGKSRVLGFRGLDPDKAIGGAPCICYLTFGERVVCREIKFALDRSVPQGVCEYFGVSCVDLIADVGYALEKGIKYIELRCDKKSWGYDPAQVALIKEWRKKTNGFLSVHMPNLKWKEGHVEGTECWHEVLEYALELEADHLTIHPPRRTCRRDVLENPACFAELLSYYVEAVQRMPKTATIGIENLHWDEGEPSDENRCFALIPEEQLLWVDAINGAVGQPDRVGCVLDTGHARNNGVLAKRYPLSCWYAAIGPRAVAYHVHQSVKDENGRLKNHKPLTCWYGPMINYCGFLWAWEQGILNRAPIFLEVKGWENHEKSLRGFEKDFL